MSRSFKRQPFATIYGRASAKQDKTLAHRGERRAHRDAIRKAVIEGDFFESFLPPHKLECFWNNVYGWIRDGHPVYLQPSEYFDDEWCARMMRK